MKKILLIINLILSFIYAQTLRDDALKVVKDTDTTLMWSDDSSIVKVNDINDAKNYCKNLKFAGYSDWRLPNQRELLSITDLSKSSFAINENFKNIGSNSQLAYWSFDSFESDIYRGVYFYYGNSNTKDENTNSYVRCVRGQELKKSFIRDDENEIVIDNETSVIWQDSLEVKTKTRNYNEALSYCNSLVFAGYDDWRLPTIDELRDIINYTDVNSTIFKEFKNCFIGENWWQSFYWSSSSSPNDRSYKWGVSFKYGYDRWDNIYNKNYTRCIREDSFKIDILKGWNLVSIPIKFDLNLISDKYRESNGNYENTILGEYEIIALFRNKEWLVNQEIKEINFREGFWIKSSKDTQIEIKGKSYLPKSFNLTTGWNLVSTGVKIENPKDKYEFKTIWIYINGKWVENPETIKVGSGFWMNK